MNSRFTGNSEPVPEENHNPVVSPSARPHLQYSTTHIDSAFFNRFVLEAPSILQCYTCLTDLCFDVRYIPLVQTVRALASTIPEHDLDDDLQGIKIQEGLLLRSSGSKRVRCVFHAQVPLPAINELCDTDMITVSVETLRNDAFLRILIPVCAKRDRLKNGIHYGSRNIVLASPSRLKVSHARISGCLASRFLSSNSDDGYPMSG
jgi:hypothetical protein